MADLTCRCYAGQLSPTCPVHGDECSCTPVSDVCPVCQAQAAMRDIQDILQDIQTAQPDEPEGVPLGAIIDLMEGAVTGMRTLLEADSSMTIGPTSWWTVLTRGIAAHPHPIVRKYLLRELDGIYDDWFTR